MRITKGYEPLSTEDELFVALDSRRLPMTIALLAIFEDAGTSFDEILSAIDSRLHLVPRFRKKLMSVPIDRSRLVWVDDEDFDLRFHVRHVGLPRPGGHRELLAFASRVFSAPLDFERPLWEMWIVDLPDGRRALLQKSHHCLVDGISAVDIATVLFDTKSQPAQTAAPPPWAPEPTPSGARLIRDTVIDDVKSPVRAGKRMLNAALRPVQTISHSLERARGVESFLSASLPPAASTSLSRKVRDPYRVLETVSGSLDAIRPARKRHGATVNDVVLSVAAAGVGRLLRSRGESTDGLIVRTVIPVSTRDEDQHFTYGNMIAAMVAELPVGERDPWKRLELVKRCTSEAKSTKQSAGVEFVAQMGDFAPSSLVAIAGRIATRQPMYSLVVTNVPGPREALYFVGGKMLEAYFFGPNLIHTTDLAIAVLSYNGQLNFGLTADRRTAPDVAEVAAGVAEALNELSEG